MAREKDPTSPFAGAVDAPPNPDQPAAEVVVDQPAVVGADEATLAEPAEPVTIKLTIAGNSPDAFIGFVNGEEYRIERGEEGLDVGESLIEPLVYSALINGVVLNATPLEPAPEPGPTQEG